ncbi:dihydrolipoamide acetyltransferase component of pyruvate dehydrogenase complex [Puia dinghuensis]|uniref:Dihydrolipoamide acetyltransferase component of pyruvate dehydrogenase complex n=2 Tax=Puia dinghuensis TaxID=1792502 RepID=A0A8J2UB30_9BACT|nr:dihydrolipoamide acetyltransferase component of pyruvate dehydrogenase complex [Puia dinghuensis]
MGESIMEATILKWHKQPGDAVKQDETVLEIATDKVDSEVPSITEGVMEEVLYQVNDVVPIGSVIARIRTSNGAAATPPVQEAVTVTPTPTATQNHHPAPQVFAANPGTPRFYSPLVLNIAASEGVPLSELESIPGTGNEGRVTKKDILQYIADRRSGHVPTAAATTPAGAAYPAAATPAATTSYPAATPPPSVTPTRTTPETINTQPPIVLGSGNVEIIEMDRMRRLIADHMVRSVHTSPHVTSISEADVTHLVQWREKVKNEFEKREGTKLTFTPLFIEAVIRCIKKYPLVNSSVDGDKIILKKDINIGMATALPSGNLIVPVIRNADQLNLTGLARQVNTLADNARQNKLRPEDTQGGTFTLTNVGTFGSLMGTPIINQPQVAILAVGAIKKRPMVLETDGGDAIVIRHMMYLSLSYDHRIVDGSLGATFCSAVARELENFPVDRQL